MVRWLPRDLTVIMKNIQALRHYLMKHVHFKILGEPCVWAMWLVWIKNCITGEQRYVDSVWIIVSGSVRQLARSR